MSDKFSLYWGIYMNLTEQGDNDRNPHDLHDASNGCNTINRSKSSIKILF